MDSTSHHLISDEYTEVYSRLSLRLQLTYGIGHVLNDICASMWFTYLLVFFHLVLQFDNWEAGLILLIGQIADAVATPFVGFHSDNSDNFWFCRYGKRKTWHLVGTICVLGAFPFIFSPCINCEGSHKWAQILYYSVFVIIFQFGWAAVQISHLSLIPELTPNEHDRTKLIAIRYSFTVISNVLVYLITWAVLHINSDSNESQIGPSDAYKFQTVVWIGLSIGIFCSVIFHLGINEENQYSINNVRAGQPKRHVFDLLSRIEVYQVALTYMSTRLFVNLSQVFIPLYLHETLNMAASALALIPLIMYLGSFLTSIAVEKINRGFGRKIAYVTGTLIGVSACVWIQFGSKSFAMYDIYPISLLFGIGGSIILVTSLGITADLIGDKTSSGAFVYGVMSFTDKIANGIAVVIIQELHKSHSEKTYYRDIITYVCGGSAVLGAAAVISLLKRRRGRL
ncbi:major facilitator superfamily domain-containing protein 12 isoform X2 [Agrilus planipennis]|uniref:Major facilitator superfamily domain-containing protein 12 isoform X2 n=1 Tax=Agrilus planipennis TaxID=224129 RepID=A0A1W4XMR4_AGRPL|nr:major facilitator superfamily domain-containing protein 12 isoform X2 [Agrilus planipennis]